MEFVLMFIVSVCSLFGGWSFIFFTLSAVRANDWKWSFIDVYNVVFSILLMIVGVLVWL